MFGKQGFAAALIVLALSAAVLADGKMYVRETVPPTIPYQRALILFKGGVQTLILQSKYELPEEDGVVSLGWVVPVPAVPEVASMPAEHARHLFWLLSFRSRPALIKISESIFGFCLAGCVIFVLIAVIRASHKPHLRHKLFFYGMGVAMLLLMAAILMPALSTVKSLGVDVIAEHQVGVYDVRVVKSEDSEALIAWLNANDFTFGNEDRAAFDDYISRGWCFVVARIDPSAEHEEYELVSEGLAAPLILRFPHDTPVYPLALTSTGGHDTEILIYLAAETKMVCDERLTLRFAGNIYTPSFLSYLIDDVEPTGFFTAEQLSYPYLCKFRNTLTAEQMKEDIAFTPASDDTPYRERIVRW
jgi:hypothetical protein